MFEMSGGKECFVICPIGSEGSEERERADKLMEHIIEEALRGYDYTPVRADQITEPGSITNQVIQKTVESDLLIADLTSHNPNVFYELAIRHAAARPYIQLIDSSESIPFDIADLRTIKYDFDVETARRASMKIQEYLEAIEDGDTGSDNPISQSAELKSWRESEDPVQQNLAEMLEGINRLNKRMDELENKVRRVEMDSSGALVEPISEMDVYLKLLEQDEIDEEFKEDERTKMLERKIWQELNRRRRRQESDK